MSHFAVAVLTKEGQEVDDLLAPYMENCCGTPDYRYIEFYGCDQCSWHDESGDDCEDCEIDEITGKRGYWQNPNAKWDWYDDDGGRFRKYAEGLIGAQRIAVEDIRFDAKAHRRAAEEWWQANMDADGKPKTPFAIWENDGMTREQFIESRAHLSFRAVVTPDGEWHEPGEMGWFGISSESADEMYEWRLHFAERFLEPNHDCTLTVVDCHI